MLYLGHRHICILLFLLFSLTNGIELQAQCSVSASSSGFNSAYSQEYVLVDALTNEILAVNSSGTFTGVNPGVYHIHALNFNPLAPPSPLPGALIGMSIEQVGSIQQGCYNADFLSDFAVVSCGTCTESETICENDALVVSSSGFNPTYTQMYVLVDASSHLILSTNATGIFTGLIGAGNSYEVYALNYNPSDPPMPLPIVGENVNSVGTIVEGCYNADFLIDYLCYNVTDCLNDCYSQSDIIQGVDIIASSSGSNSEYIQIYVLTDDDGNLLAQNSSGIFSSSTLTEGEVYHVHAINYNPADPPNPLPSDLMIGENLSQVNGGCYNQDLLDDYICFNILPDLFLAIDEIELSVTEANEFNHLNWDYQSSRLIQDGLFQVQRKSADGHTTTVLAEYGYDYSTSQYFHQDINPPAEAYYRIYFSSGNGVIEYSDWIYVERDFAPNSINLYPNPCQDVLLVGVFSSQESLATLKISNVLNQVIYSSGIKLYPGQNNIQMNSVEWESGMYFLSVEFAKALVSKRFIKE